MRLIDSAPHVTVSEFTGETIKTILEDVAGNRVGHAFEVDLFQRADSTNAPERYTIPFKIP